MISYKFYMKVAKIFRDFFYLNEIVFRDFPRLFSKCKKSRESSRRDFREKSRENSRRDFC